MSTAPRTFDPFPARRGERVSPVDPQFRWARPFESGRGRATVTILLLACAVAVEIVNAVLNYQQWRRGGTGARRTASFAFPELLGEVLLVGSIIAFAIWTHRVYRNLPALGTRELHYTPGWAVAWLFIPLANLVIPYFVFREIWRASLPARTGETAVGKKAQTPLLLIGWWTLNILPVVAIVVGTVVVLYSDFGASGADLWQSIDKLDSQLDRVNALVVPPLAAAAAVLAIFVIGQIDNNQSAKHEQLLVQARPSS
jgi:hypothetical protein